MTGSLFDNKYEEEVGVYYDMSFLVEMVTAPVFHYVSIEPVQQLDKRITYGNFVRG